MGLRHRGWALARRGSGEVTEAAVDQTLLRRRPEFDRLFDALADAERLRLLEALLPRVRDAMSLATELRWSRDATVKQLKLLERAGLVAGQPAPRRRVAYVCRSDALTVALDWASDLWACVSGASLDDTTVPDRERQVQLAAALRAQGRRDMLECMCRGGRITQSAAAEDCGLSQGLASRGLARLLEARLIALQPDLKPRRYLACPAGMTELVKWLHHTAVVTDKLRW